MTIPIPGGAVNASLPAQIPAVVFASEFTPGWAPGATGKDDTAALNAACAAARAITALGNSVGKVVLDAATYFISGPVNRSNVGIFGQGMGATKILAKSDWASALPCNARFMLDEQPSVALGAPTQNASSAGGTGSGYGAGTVSSWITASNARNGGETPVSGMQQITLTAGQQPTFNWTKHTSIDASTTYNVYIDAAGGTNSANAVKIVSGQTGTSYTSNSPTGSGHPPTTDTTGGVGIVAPDFSRTGVAPIWRPEMQDLWVCGPSADSHGAVVAHLSGVRQGGTTVLRGLRIDGGLFAAIYQNQDHEEVYTSRLGGYYGVYRGTPYGDNGDQVFESLVVSSSWAGFAAAAPNAYGGAHFRKVHIAECPFGFYKESIDVGGQSRLSQLVNGCTLDQIAFESTGNGNFFSAGAASVTVSGNSMNNVNATNSLDPGTTLPTTTQDWQGVAIGRFNACVDLNGASFSGNNVVGGDPNLPHASQTGYTCGIAALVEKGGAYEATQLITRLRLDGKPFTNAGSYNADSIIYFNGKRCRLFYASGTISQDDLVMAASGGQPTVTRSTGANKPVGVAMTAATNSQAVLVAQSGPHTVNSSTNTITIDQPVIADATNNGAVVGSASPSVANSVGVALQGSSGGKTQVLLQGLA